ncbi:MAG TPA: hypothetical protein VK452_03180 [Dissulfurispiraceae bacterium]|nr:hypothetical protein [Dissulfurispiraceae bacterium]
MLSFKKFLTIFKGLGFSEKELHDFYQSVSKTVILRIAGKRLWPEIFRIEEQHQWPILCELDAPELPIYRGADKALLGRFIGTIRDEKELRLRKPHMDKVRYWTRLRIVIDERIELFTDIFGFSEADINHCEIVAARYSKIVDDRIVRKKKLWKIGLGTGAATLAGAAAWYLYIKDKK